MLLSKEWTTDKCYNMGYLKNLKDIMQSEKTETQ